ncbi:MAG: HEAT repeat domain-containing protein [Planctomycetes bacterium]|nr:HEAT repeat domain-containing protein [Planctomycetota bacterium]
MAREPDYLGVSVAEWTRALKSENPIQRRLAVYALGEIVPRATSAVGDLIAALDDPQPYVRVWAAAALARIAPERDEAFAVFRAALQDELAFVRSLAAWHLGRLGSRLARAEEAIDHVTALLDDANPSVRAEAELALHQLSGKGAPPVELRSLVSGS